MALALALALLTASLLVKPAAGKRALRAAGGLLLLKVPGCAPHTTTRGNPGY